MPSSVTAVVVTYNSAAYVEALLDSLPAAMGRLSYRTVVVDNGSSDATVSIVAARSDCDLVTADNRGFASGVNLGARQGDGEAILVLNPDATLCPASVEVMAEALRPPVGIVAPRVLEADGSLSTSLRREPTLARACGLSFTRRPALAEIVTDPAEYEYSHVVDWAMGAILLVARQCFDALDGFDESFFLYSEETDFCLRARDQGWTTLYTPHAGAMHVGGGSGTSATTYAMQVLNRARLYSRRHSTAQGAAYYSALVLREATWSLSGRRESVAAFRALVSPSRRPPQLNLPKGLVPR